MRLISLSQSDRSVGTERSVASGTPSNEDRISMKVRSRSTKNAVRYSLRNVLVLSLLAAVVAGVAHAAVHPVVFRSGDQYVARPLSLSMRTDDSKRTLSGLHWFAWGGAVAQAHATYTVCREGSPCASLPVVLKLDHLTRYVCSDWKPYVYRRALVYLSSATTEPYPAPAPRGCKS
jgi:hypothetical protein